MTNAEKKQVLKQISERLKVNGWVSAMPIVKKYGLRVRDVEFGLETNPTAREEKARWCAAAGEFEVRAHLASLAVKASKTGWSYNRMRARSVSF